MLKHGLLVLGLGLALTGCSSTAPPASSGASTPAPMAAAQPDEHHESEHHESEHHEEGGHGEMPGKALFQGTCSACHGQDAHGIAGLGKPLVGSKMLDKTDHDLVAFINHGRAPTDPDNTTGVAMPPKGGNPALNDDQLGKIVAYIRTLK